MCYGLAGVYLAVSSENKVWAAHYQGQADHRTSQEHNGCHPHRGRGEEVSARYAFFTYDVWSSSSWRVSRDKTSACWKVMWSFELVFFASFCCAGLINVLLSSYLPASLHVWQHFLFGGWVFRVAALEDREYQMDRLEFVKNQLNLLIDEIKKKIKAISEDVESKVTKGEMDFFLPWRISNLRYLLYTNTCSANYLLITFIWS